MGNHVAQTSGILRRIQRHDHRARARRGKKSHAKMVIVRQQETDSVARFDSCVPDELAKRARFVDQCVKRD